MRVVTFAGNVTYLDWVVRKNKVTDVYLDKSYTYRLGTKWENVPDTLLPEDTTFLDDKEVQKLSEKLRSNNVHVVITDTGVNYARHEEEGDISKRIAFGGAQVIISRNLKEMMNRRLRIAKMITKILEDIHDDILFVDSDVMLNENVFNEITNIISSSTSPTPISICIPALMKPFMTTIFTFCYSTNFYLPSQLHDELYNALKLYIDREKYVLYPVDLFMHNFVLHTSKTININGVCHYIRGNLYCT